MRRPTNLIVVLLALLGVAVFACPARASQSAAPSPPPRATFGIQPASSAGPDARPYLIYPVAAGTVVADHVAIVNYSRTPLTLKVYATDAFNAADGSFALFDRTMKPKDAGTWFALKPQGGGSRQITVGPRSFRVLPVTLRIPPGASPGDHVAGLVVALTAASKANGPNVDLDQRVGVRTYVRVTGPLHPKLSLEDVVRKYHGTLNPLGTGTTSLDYTVHNTGNVALSGQQLAQAHGMLGPTFHAAGLKDLPLLVPGGSIRVHTLIRHTWPLVFMTGEIDVRPRVLSDVFSGAVVSAHSSGHYVAVPWTLLAVVLLLLLGDQLRCRRRHRSPQLIRGRHAAPSRRTEASAASVARAVLAGLLLVLIGAGPASADDQVPYTDSRVTGGVTLCGVDGKPVYTGKVTDKPFVWLAIGDSAATGIYADPGRTAFLGAYQPRKGVEPGAWSGFELNASSTFDTVAHPASQSTPKSSPLNDFLGRYHPDWDGLVQLRLILLGSNRPVQTSRYDATDIKVVGDTWHVVRGGSASCSSGKATSSAVLLNLPGAAGTPPPGAVASPPPLTTSPRPQVSNGATSPAGTGDAPPTVAASPARMPESSKGVLGASLGPVIVIAGLAALATGLVTAWAMRRRT